MSLAQLTPDQNFKLELTDSAGVSKEITLTAKSLQPKERAKQGEGA